MSNVCTFEPPHSKTKAKSIPKSIRIAEVSAKQLKQVIKPLEKVSKGVWGKEPVQDRLFEVSLQKSVAELLVPLLGMKPKSALMWGTKALICNSGTKKRMFGSVPNPFWPRTISPR